MSKLKKTELQVTVHGQDQWDALLQKDGLIVVDAYAAWCGPCKAIVSTLKRIKNESGDDLLHFATAETDNIDSLSLYRGKSQPTFLFYCNGVLVYVIRGCNCPVIIKAIASQLEKEHKVLEGKAERIEYIDEVVGAQPEAKTDDEKEGNEEDEETAAKMTESMLRMKNRVSFRDLEETEVSKEVSLAIIKPDAVKAGLVEEIIAKVKSEGMEILRQEEKTLTKEEAAEFYRQHKGSEHFEDLVEFMSSGPCMTLIISKGETGEGVIPQFRDLIGPKDVNKAKEEAPDSIRAVYGTSSVMNAIHACDTSESAARELAFFFPNFVSPTVKTKKATTPSTQTTQRTLALIRPDALRNHKDSILDKIKEAGFSIAMAKEVTLTKEEAEDFYDEHKGKDFFEPLVQNMCSGPVLALCLAKEDAVEGWRNLLGPKEIDVAKDEAPESLRAQFHVEESDMNPLHGSKSHSAARREIEKIFPVETTVAVIKPETAEESGDKIINRIQEAGFRIVSRKDVGLTKELAGQFYHEHEGKDFFNGLTDYMSSGQSTVLLLEREDAVTGWRALMGPTDPEEAREKAPDSIRAEFGKDICKNAVHGSSNMDRAGHVIEELFPEVELLPNGRAIVRSKSEVAVSGESEIAVSEEQDSSGQTEQDDAMQGTEDTKGDVGVTEDKVGDVVKDGETIGPGEQQVNDNQDNIGDEPKTVDGDDTGVQRDGRGSADAGDDSASITGDDTRNLDGIAKESHGGDTVKGDVVIDTPVADTNPDDGASTTENANNATTDSTTADANDGTTTTTNENTPENENSGVTKSPDKAPTDGTNTPTQIETGADPPNGGTTGESRVAADTTLVPDENVDGKTVAGNDTTNVDAEVIKE